jgi:hypothetical protein
MSASKISLISFLALIKLKNPAIARVIAINPLRWRIKFFLRE